MKLSPVVSRYFDVWIINDTWDSGHRLDRERFYRFVKAVVRYSRKIPSPGDIQELIEQQWQKTRSPKALQAAADEFSSLYQTLIEYERINDFPNAMIERKNIRSFYHRLIREYEIIQKGKRIPEKPSKHHIDDVMTRVWGKSWRSQLNLCGGAQSVAREVILWQIILVSI